MSTALHGFAPPCAHHCDFTNPVMRGRATWLCRKCGRDFSLEYLFWHQTAHPEDWYEKAREE